MLKFKNEYILRGVVQRPVNLKLRSENDKLKSRAYITVKTELDENNGKKSPSLTAVAFGQLVNHVSDLKLLPGDWVSIKAEIKRRKAQKVYENGEVAFENSIIASQVDKLDRETGEVISCVNHAD